MRRRRIERSSGPLEIPGDANATMSIGRMEMTSTKNHVFRYRFARTCRLRMNSPFLSGTGRKNCTTMSMTKIRLMTWFTTKSAFKLVGMPRHTSNGVTVAV